MSLKGRRIIFPASMFKRSGAQSLEKLTLRVEWVGGYPIRAANALTCEKPALAFAAGARARVLDHRTSLAFLSAKDSTRSAEL